MSMVETNCDTNNGDEELANQHAGGTIDEDGSATESLDSPERQRCRAHVDQCKDERDQEFIGNGAS